MVLQSEVERNASKKKSHLTMEMGCWTKFRFMLSCITVKPEVVTSASVSSGQHGNPDEGKSLNSTNDDQPLAQHDSASNSCSPETSSRPNIGENMKISSKLRKFSFNELKSATRNFRPENLLGEGGFGRVYKGWTSLSRTTVVKPGTGIAVAVKMLNHDGAQGHKEWLTEVNFLGDLFHIHLVNLIGYCIEEDQRLLVYEFMPRGSLESHLFRSSLPLPWANRLKIALGAAKGLAYLHDETEKPVIYRDFKTSNILLDADYNAKLSDFGLAKDGPEGEKTHVSTRVMGTYGYAAPEYVMTGHLSSKSDVYSFGVVLLEILTGRRSMDKNRPNAEQNLVEWARPQLADRRKIFRMIDPRMEGRFSMKATHKAAHLAALCINRDAKVRPTMSDVVDVLKPLLHFNDMASSSSYFQAHFRSRSAARTSFRVQTGRVNARTGRSLSTPNGPCASFHSLSGCRGSPGSISRQPSSKAR